MTVTHNTSIQKLGFILTFVMEIRESWDRIEVRILCNAPQDPENIAQITDIYPNGWITCMWVVYAFNMYCQSKQQLEQSIIFAIHNLINLKWDIYNKMTPYGHFVW